MTTPARPLDTGQARGDASLDPATPPRLYPTSQRSPASGPPIVPLGVDVAQFLPEAGYPDHSEAAQAFAAGQRAAARAQYNRANLSQSTPGPAPSAPAGAGGGDTPPAAQ